MRISDWSSDVCSSDLIDRLGHVNNSIYLRWIEEAVHAHWTAFATPAELAAYDWLAVRHEIDYRRPAHLDDRLTVATHIVGIRSVRPWSENIVTRDGETLEIAMAARREIGCCNV